MRANTLHQFDRLIDSLGVRPVVLAMVSEMTIPQMTKVQEFLSTNSGNIEDENALLLARAQLGISDAFAVLLLAEAKKHETDPRYWFSRMQKLKEQGIKLGGDNLEDQLIGHAEAVGPEVLKQWARYQSTSTITRIVKVLSPDQVQATVADPESRDEAIRWWVECYGRSRSDAEAIAARIDGSRFRTAREWFNALSCVL